MTSVKDYVKYTELGGGAFGTVYKVKKNRRGNYFAMKKIPLSGISDVHREVESQEDLPRNPYVVSLVDYHVTKRNLYLILDYCNNGTLNDYILEKRVHKRSLKRFMGDMIKGLKHLHHHNIVHRDIKPDNILLHAHSGSGRPICKLSDFGLARYSAGSDASYYDESYYLQTDCGTKYFIAPEVLTNHYTDACDVFSLGVVFYAIQAKLAETENGTLIATVDGEMPFYQASYKRINQRVNSQVHSRDIADLIKSMLHKNHRERVDVDELQLKFKMATS